MTQSPGPTKPATPDKGSLQLSIITVCLNRVASIETAIRSALDQWQDGVEHIVVDGGSTDGTLAILQRFPHLNLVSETDYNLYDAMNKGIDRARGRYMLLLNSDDALAPNALPRILAYCCQHPDKDIISGGIEVFDDRNRLIAGGSGEDAKRLNVNNVLFDVPAINARIVRTEFARSLGGFDINLPIASDRDFLLRACLDEAKNLVVPEVFYRYLHHDESLTIGGKGRRKRIAQDHIRLAEKHLKSNPTAILSRGMLLTFVSYSVLSAALGNATRFEFAETGRLIRHAFGVAKIWPVYAPLAVKKWARRRLRSLARHD